MPSLERTVVLQTRRDAEVVAEEDPCSQPTVRFRVPAALRPVRTDRPSLGEWLVRKGLLTREQLYRALEFCHRHDWRVGDAVVVLGFMARATVEAEVKIHARASNERRGLLLKQRVAELELARRSPRAASGA